jgi:hypothetical protein
MAASLLLDSILTASKCAIEQHTPFTFKLYTSNAAREQLASIALAATIAELTDNRPFNTDKLSQANFAILRSLDCEGVNLAWYLPYIRAHYGYMNFDSSCTAPKIVTTTAHPRVVYYLTLSVCMNDDVVA